MVKGLVVWTLSLSLSLSHPFVALIAVECSIANPFSPKEISGKPAGTNGVLGFDGSLPL